MPVKIQFCLVLKKKKEQSNKILKYCRHNVRKMHFPIKIYGD